MIGDEFHPTTVAKLAEIGALLSEVREKACALCDRLAVTAGIDHKVAVLCLRAGSAEWAIEGDMTGFSQSSFETKLVGEAQRAEFHHNPLRLRGGCDLPCDLIDSRGAWKAGHHNRRVARDLTGTRGDDDIGLCEFTSPRRVDIETDDAAAPVDKIAG